MTKRKTLLIGLAAVAIGLFAGIYAGQRHAASPPVVAPPLAAGSIERLFASTLDDTNGRAQAFTQWQGKTLVVNFWATWCPPCREEMPAFSQLQTKYAANDVQFVGIALDTPENVRDFAKQFPVAYPLLIGGGTATDLARQLGDAQLVLPYTLVIGPGGELRFRQPGRVSEPELERSLPQTAAR